MEKPEARTEAFFKQDVEELAVAMRDRIIALPDRDVRIKINIADPYRKDKVGARYKRHSEPVNINDLPPGILWACEFPFRNMNQALVAALDQGESGACVRLMRASLWDEALGEFRLMPREGDIATSLGLSSNDLARLSFQDDSEILYATSHNSSSINGQSVDSEVANEYFENLLKE